MQTLENPGILPAKSNRISYTRPSLCGAGNHSAALSAVARIAAPAYWVWDREADCGLLATAEAAEVFGLSPQDFLAQRRDFDRLLQRVHPDDQEAYRAAHERSQAGHPALVEFAPLGESGGPNRRIREISEPVAAADGRHLQTVGVLQEVTELWLVKAELARYENLIQRTQRMETLGTFAGGLAHDFANVLQPIVMAMEDIADSLRPDHPVQENVRQALFAAERAGDLVRRVLEFSRGEAPADGSYDICSLVEAAMKLACRTIPSSIAVTSDLRCDTGFCRLSPSEVTQIVMNLVGNANHAMEGKGALAIRLQPVVIDTVRSVRGMALQPGCYACLTVQDDGPGMPPWLADRVFEPFFTTKDIEHGTGLGLSVVHGLVGQRGGAVLLSTAPGQGARFDIYIPLVSSGQG